MVNLVLFTRIVINILINTIRGVPTTVVIIVGSSELLHKVLPSNTPLDPWPKILVDPISTPPLIEFVLDATQISILVVGMTTLNNSVTSISTWCFHISTTTFLHSWWSWVDLSLTMPHYVVTHWYPLWCKMWMWIHLFYSAPKLNGWTNLLILWSQLNYQLHAI